MRNRKARLSVCMWTSCLFHDVDPGWYQGPGVLKGSSARRRAALNVSAPVVGGSQQAVLRGRCSVGPTPEDLLSSHRCNFGRGLVGRVGSVCLFTEASGDTGGVHLPSMVLLLLGDVWLRLISQPAR